MIYVYGSTFFDGDDFVLGFTDLVLSWIFPVITIIGFWIYRQSTPGKMAISAKIVDAKTGEKPTLQQFIVRYIGYFLASIPLGLGILWVAWDKRKQGWHDKLANTVVISKKNSGEPKDVEFSSKTI